MSEKGHILIVDDTLQNIQVLGTMLRAEDYQVSVAMNGQQALEGTARVDPDLILLDVMMPEMDGIEVCKRLKADEKTKDIPVIFLTALTEIDDRMRGFDVGGADYVTKPFEGPELLRRVETHLTLHQTMKELAQMKQNL